MNLWSSLLLDPVTINLSVGTAAFGNPNIIGATSSSRSFVSYANVRDALSADRTSNDDISSSGSLSRGAATPLLINYTSDNPSGAGSFTPYLDNDNGANNTSLLVNTANLKALGISFTPPRFDGAITFNSAFSFDYDQSDGIGGGQIDFVGVAVHEIGHALGFVSGVDNLDTSNGQFGDDQFRANTLDLFRFSDASVAQGVGVFDLSAGLSGTRRYFSVDGGASAIANFSVGAQRGARPAFGRDANRPARL